VSGALTHAATHAFTRALRARLLPAATWRALLNEPDVDGVARRLTDSPYGPEPPREPAQLERLLLAHVAAETLSAAAFEWGGCGRLLAVYARRYELANLKTALRARHHGVAGERVDAVMVPLPRSVLPWRALMQAPSMEAFADLLGDTPYGRPILSVLEQDREAEPFAFEVALDLAYFQALVRRIRRLGGRDAARARAFLGGWIAVENLSRAFRYRRLSGLTPEETVNYTLHSAFGAGLDAVRRVALGATVADEAARLGFVVDPAAPEEEALAGLERASTEARAAAAAQAFAGAPFDIGAPLALITLQEVEVQDLITLIEGRAAGLPRTALAARLLGPYARTEA
jgi:vacuolar-type H+-ATPase subunit C/Vma6